LQAELPGALEEIIESHGRVSTVAIDSASSEWHHDLSVHPETWNPKLEAES